MAYLKARRSFILLLIITGFFVLGFLGLSIKNDKKQSNAIRIVQNEASLLLKNVAFIPTQPASYECRTPKFTEVCTAGISSKTETSRTIVEEYLKNAELIKQRLSENSWQQDSTTYQGAEIDFKSAGERSVKIFYTKTVDKLHCEFSYDAYDLADLPRTSAPETQAFYNIGCGY